VHAVCLSNPSVSAGVCLQTLRDMPNVRMIGAGMRLRSPSSSGLEREQQQQQQAVNGGECKDQDDEASQEAETPGRLYRLTHRAFHIWLVSNPVYQCDKARGHMQLAASIIDRNCVVRRLLDGWLSDGSDSVANARRGWPCAAVYRLVQHIAFSKRGSVLDQAQLLCAAFHNPVLALPLGPGLFTLEVISRATHHCAALLSMETLAW
jgi:hypothetical protein